MLHPHLLTELLAAEVEVARDRVAGRYETLDLDGTTVTCTTVIAGVVYRIALNGDAYDAEPLKLAVVDPAGTPLPAASWPPGLSYGEHPVLGRPWACVRGTFEYHLYPGHHAESWDGIRREVRLADLLDHLLRKAGA